MLAINFMLFFVPLLSFILIGVNFLLAPHTPYKEKKTPFECGYHSFTSQTRTQFNIMFSLFGFVFLLLDLEIVLTYPYGLSSYNINIYGLVLAGVFVLIVTLGFGFEIGKGALNIETKQSNIDNNLHSKKSIFPLVIILKIFSVNVIRRVIRFTVNLIISTLHRKISKYIANNIIMPIFYNKLFTSIRKINYKKIDLNSLGISYIKYGLLYNFIAFFFNTINFLWFKKTTRIPYSSINIYKFDYKHVLNILNHNNTSTINFINYGITISLYDLIFLGFCIAILCNLGLESYIYLITIKFIVTYVFMFINHVLYSRGYYENQNHILPILINIFVLGISVLNLLLLMRISYTLVNKLANMFTDFLFRWLASLGSGQYVYFDYNQGGSDSESEHNRGRSNQGSSNQGSSNQGGNNQGGNNQGGNNNNHPGAGVASSSKRRHQDDDENNPPGYVSDGDKLRRARQLMDEYRAQVRSELPLQNTKWILERREEILEKYSNPERTMAMNRIPNFNEDTQSRRDSAFPRYDTLDGWLFREQVAYMNAKSQIDRLYDARVGPEFVPGFVKSLLKTTKTNFDSCVKDRDELARKWTEERHNWTKEKKSKVHIGVLFMNTMNVKHSNLQARIQNYGKDTNRSNHNNR